MRTLIVAILVVWAASAAVMATGCEDVSVEDGLSGTGNLPLVPFDLPVFPTDITMEGLESELEDLVDEYDVFGFFDEDDIADAEEWLAEQMEEASLEILQPGVLSVSADNKIAESIRDVVTVTNVGVRFEVTNNTDAWVAVPIEFQLFLGDGEAAEAWDESVLIPFADPRVDEDGKFIIEPGESLDLEIDSVPHLVTALNESDSIGIGYKAIYRVADADNGADIPGVINKFGLCIAGKVVGLDIGDCPGIDELIDWHLTVNKFELSISAEADFEIPDLEDCSEFADEFGLDNLKEACE